MAVQKIKVVSIIGRMNDLDKVTFVCGKSEIFHPDNSLSFFSNTEDFTPQNDENPYSELLQELNEAVVGVNKELKLLNAKEAERFRLQAQKNEIKSYVETVSDSFNNLQEKRATSQQKIHSYSHSIAEISHFVGLDLDLEQINACEYIKVRFGSLPKESYEKLNSYDKDENIVFLTCTNDEEHYWGVYFAPIDMISEVDRIFSRLYFEEIKLTNLTSSPEKVIASTLKQREAEKDTLKSIDSEIDVLWKKRKINVKKFTLGLLRNQYITVFAITHLDTMTTSFLLAGFLPTKKKHF